MADPLSTIADAFEKLQQSVSVEDAHDFASTDLKNVWQAVREIDAIQRKRQTAQNLRRVEPLLRGLEKYSKVIEVLCNGTPYMPYVWAPIKLMLQLASQHRNVFEALLTAYAEIGAALPRFDRYETAFRENKEFQNVLASVYCSILHFHQRAYKFFRRRAWNLMFISLWTDFESRFASIIDGLKTQRDFVDREAASIDIAEAKDSRSRTQEDILQRQKHSLILIEQNEIAAQVARLQHAITWLAVDDGDQEASYERVSRRRHDDTCGWIMKEAHMKSWISDGSSHPLLWLSGKPGAGKSVMCSYIISQLLDMLNLDTLYYFCNSQGGTNIPRHVLQTLALQLLRHHPDAASLITNEFVYQGVNCGIGQLRSLVSKLLTITPCARIVIDGIDECLRETQNSLLKDLQALCQNENKNCKILFSSRKEVHLTEKLSKKPHISLDNRDEVTLDIQRYIKYEIMNLRTSDKKLRGKVEAILVDKANGMFLWVRLVVEELRNCYRDSDLERKANSLPRGIDGAYKRILDRISDEHSTEIAIRILEWIACSHRLLKIYEILDGIAFTPDSTTLDGSKKYIKEVLNLCRPLIEDGPKDTLDFVHFSAKRYILEGKFDQAKPFLNRETANFNITFSCIAYLNTSLCLLPTFSTLEKRADLIISGLHGLQLYANRFWVDHLLSYCEDLQKAQKMPRSELLAQLNILLKMQKDSVATEDSITGLPIDILQVLDQHSDIKTLISRVLAFRAKTQQDAASKPSEKSTEDISLEFCSLDPFHFSAIRYHYQCTVEILLDPQMPGLYGIIDPQRYRAFTEAYGHSAFVCRYQHCPRDTDGFQCLKQRDMHEATHRKKFRCAYPSCVNFSTGFTSRGTLKRHNEKYHAAFNNTTSLAEGVLNSQGSPGRLQDLIRQLPNISSTQSVQQDVLRSQMSLTSPTSPIGSKMRRMTADTNFTKLSLPAVFPASPRESPPAFLYLTVETDSSGSLSPQPTSPNIPTSPSFV